MLRFRVDEGNKKWGRTVTHPELHVFRVLTRRRFKKYGETIIMLWIYTSIELMGLYIYYINSGIGPQWWDCLENSGIDCQLVGSAIGDVCSSEALLAVKWGAVGRLRPSWRLWLGLFLHKLLLQHQEPRLTKVASFQKVLAETETWHIHKSLLTPFRGSMSPASHINKTVYILFFFLRTIEKKSF